MVMVRLLKRSARKPPVMENRMNGSANSAPTMPTRRLLFSSGRFMPVMRKMASHFSVLSLNAPWNCVTMSAQKPCVVSGGGLVAAGLASFMAATLSIKRRGRELKKIRQYRGKQCGCGQF
jgi:hypothetical protein